MKSLILFNRLKSLPGGTRLFSIGVCKIAPYFGSISPHVEELRSGYARVSMRKQRKVENHIRSVHAVAMCNMAELAGGLMTDASVAEGVSWIPVGMTVEYRKKAGSDLVAVAKGDDIDWHTNGNIVVPIEITDSKQNLVFTAAITMNLKQKT